MAHDDGHPDKASAKRFVDGDLRKRGRKDDPKGKEGRDDPIVDREAELGPPEGWKPGEDDDD